MRTAMATARTMARGAGRWLLAAALAAAWSGARAAPAIRLGAHAPETGSLAKHGMEQVKGIRVAVDEFGKRTGIPVELLVYDDESQPPKAVAAVEKLAGNDKVAGIVGGYGSNLVGPASEAAERWDVPYLTTGAVDTKLSAKRFQTVFRLNYMPGYAAAQSGAIREIFQARKVAILYNSQSATTEIAEAVKGQLTAGGAQVPVFEKFEKGTTNYKPLLLKVKDAGCEVLLVEGYFPDYVGTIKDAKVLALPVKAYVGAWGIGTPEFVRELGPLAEHVYGTSIWEMGTAPAAAREDEARFVAAYRARFHEDPSYIAMLGYLSAEYMLQALAKGGGSAEKARAALRSMDAPSPIGRVAFDDKGDPLHFSAVLFQSRGGKQVVVYPRDRATGSVVYPAVPWAAK